MKIIEFKGGLGNQLFEYAHYIYLKSRRPDERYYSYFPSRELWQHNGLEIHRRFEVELPPTTRITNILGWLLFTINRKWLNPMGIRSSLIATETFPNDEAFFQDGYWEEVKYIPKDFKYTYKPINLNEKTKMLLDNLMSSRYSDIGTPVAVHVRRGDYLTCDHPEYFSGICTMEYYNGAIGYIQKHVKKPIFYFFSDDSKYVSEHWEMPNKIVVDWNKGADSIQDMYLMSHFPALILANSTFSFWGAQNNQYNPLVICPPKFNNLPYPSNMVMPGWIALNENGCEIKAQ